MAATHNFTPADEMDNLANRLAVMKRRQEAERKWVELELQLKFLKEKEQMLAEELGAKKSPETSILLPFCASEYTMQHAQRNGRGQIHHEGALRNTTTVLPVFAGESADWPLFIAF